MRRFYGVAMLSIVLLCLAAVTSVFAADDMSKGADAYKRLKCAKCHGDGGKGDGPTVKKLKAKGKDIEMHDWTDSAFMSRQTDEYLTEITSKGGKAVGKSKRMPSYKKKLQDGDLEELLAFIKSFSS